MPRPKIAIDEAALFEACKEGATVTALLKIIPVNRETMRKRVMEYVNAGRLVWAKRGRRGNAGILKTVQA